MARAIASVERGNVLLEGGAHHEEPTGAPRAEVEVTVLLNGSAESSSAHLLLVTQLYHLRSPRHEFEAR